MISLKNLDKRAVLAALYNASRPQGMGFLHYDPAPMTTEEAAKLLEQTTYFDYLKGRVMKVELGWDSLDPYGYDRNNGEGAAEQALAALAVSPMRRRSPSSIKPALSRRRKSRRLA